MQPHDPAARLLVALEQWDDLALASVLNPDVRLVVDSGDDTGGDLHGRAHVTRVLRERLARHPEASLHIVHVNGRSGVALRRHDGAVLGVLSIEGTETIEALWLSTAPRKLAHWNRRRPALE
ncbi:hypothetical protein [Agromyces ramosus]|uniref:RNA polymerase sigma-70 factor (ECF subfamily) n=1 Tax=Agromyces ramosus TaxID=33879 RepID=A0ABU0RD09_9MICO|nr:hypothetical protein [Agromyces ramosus]MDQ0894939.1 hypothetical protein [Agromyces ramosus]